MIKTLISQLTEMERNKELKSNHVQFAMIWMEEQQPAWNHTAAALDLQCKK